MWRHQSDRTDLSAWRQHALSLLAHLGPGDDDPDEADVVGADAVQALVDALREELPAVVARLDYEQAECQLSDFIEILDKQNMHG